MHLLVKKDGKLLHRLDVTLHKPLILGRSKKCDVQLKDEKISRHHLKVSASNKGLVFEDLQSRNGTFYKNARIKTKELFSGQTIQVGDYHLQVENVNTSDQKTMAMIQDDSATEVALMSEDLEMFSDDSPQEPTHAAQNPPSLAFMEAIAVSNAPANTIDDISEDNPSPTTTDVGQPNADVWDEPESIVNAPHADIADDIEQAMNSATYSDAQLEPPSTPADQNNPADLKTEVMGQSQDSQPKETPETKEASTSNFFFSSMDDSADGKVDEIRDVYTATKKNQNQPLDIGQQPSAPSDTQQNVETGSFDIPPADSMSSGRTEIRNFSAEPSEPTPDAHSTKRKPLFLFLIAIGIGIGLLIIDEKDTIFGKKPSTDKTTTGQKQPASKSTEEDERLAMHLIEETQSALDAQDLDTAKEKMKILLQTYPQTESLQTFMPSYQQAKQNIEDQQAEQEAQKQEKENQINVLLTKGKKLVDQKEFDAAKETFEKILSIAPEHAESIDWLTKAEELAVQEEYKDFARIRRHKELDRIYKLAVESFETGQFGKAKEFLRTVSDDRTHPKAFSADKLLQQIATQTDSKLEQKIIQAKNKITSLATLPEGYQELKTIVDQFPQRNDAQSYYKQAQSKMLEKAKQLYAEGIAQQELAGDYATALDLYKEVLIYAPDPNEEYYRKAKARIDNLEL